MDVRGLVRWIHPPANRPSQPRIRLPNTRFLRLQAQETLDRHVIYGGHSSTTTRFKAPEIITRHLPSDKAALECQGGGADVCGFILLVEQAHL